MERLEWDAATVYGASLSRNGRCRRCEEIEEENLLDLTPLRNGSRFFEGWINPHCMSLIDTYEDDHCLHLVTEMYTGGELFDHLVKMKPLFSERDAAHIMRQVIEGLAYCHKNDVAHRDIKPEDIMFKTSEPIHNFVSLTLECRASSTLMIFRQRCASRWALPHTWPQKSWEVRTTISVTCGARV